METLGPISAIDRVRELRLARRETLEQFGAHIGVASKGRMSELERGITNWTPEQALAVERLSGGEISAAELNGIIAQARGLTSTGEAA